MGEGTRATGRATPGWRTQASHAPVVHARAGACRAPSLHLVPQCSTSARSGRFGRLRQSSTDTDNQGRRAANRWHRRETLVTRRPEQQTCSLAPKLGALFGRLRRGFRELARVHVAVDIGAVSAFRAIGGRGRGRAAGGRAAVVARGAAGGVAARSSGRGGCVCSCRACQGGPVADGGASRGGDGAALELARFVPGNRFTVAPSDAEHVGWEAIR